MSSEVITGAQKRFTRFWWGAVGLIVLVVAAIAAASMSKKGDCALDLHATILHLLGLDHDSLAVTQGGRRIRLTGLQGGKMVKEIFA